MIINAILNEHQVVADIVAFVGRGDFPRSRLGEKQRGKILASWVTRKMRTIAQFSIRDPESEEAMTAVPEDRVTGPPSYNRGSYQTISDRPISSAHQQQALAQRFSGAEDPNYVTEQNLPYESSIVESPPAVADPNHHPHSQQDATPIGQATEYFPPQTDSELPIQPPQISPAKQQQPLSNDINKEYFAQVSPSSHDPEQTPVAPQIRNQGLYQPAAGLSQGYDGYDDTYEDGAFDDNYAHTPMYAKQAYLDPKKTYLEPTRTAYGNSNGSNDTAGGGGYVPYHPNMGADIVAPVTPDYTQIAGQHHQEQQIGIAVGGDGFRGNGSPRNGEEWPREAILHMRQHGQ